MRRVLTVMFFIALAQVAASAQDTRVQRGYGYGFAGVATNGSGRTSALGGAGGEVRLYKGLGVGAEAAVGDDFGMFSANGSYHFTKSGSQKLVPFVTGGYTLLGPSDSTNLVNYGAGLNYWASDRVGLRFEVRDHVFIQGSNHIVGLRVGVTFR